MPVVRGMSNQRSDQNGSPESLLSRSTDDGFENNIQSTENDSKPTELKIKTWEDIKLLENELKAKCQEVTKLKDDRDGFEKMAAKLTSEVADLKLNLDELKSTKACLETALELLNEKVSKLGVERQQRSSDKFSEKKFEREDVDTWNSHKVTSSKISFDNSTIPSFINDTSSACSGKKGDIHEASNLSLRSGEVNRFDEKEKVENRILNFDNTYVDSSSETNNVKHPENTNQSNSTFKTNSSNCHLENSTESPSNDIKKCEENKELSKKSLNVLAKAFIPNNAPACIVSNYNFSNYSLEDLLDCYDNLMNDHISMDFAYHFKVKVTERLSEFKRFVRKELEFLCFLIDASESENNQKLIVSRMVKIVSYNLGRHPPPSNVRKYCYCKTK